MMVSIMEIHSQQLTIIDFCNSKIMIQYHEPVKSPKKSNAPQKDIKFPIRINQSETSYGTSTAYFSRRQRQFYVFLMCVTFRGRLYKSITLNEMQSSHILTKSID